MHISLVRSLYQDRQSLVIGSISASATALFSAWVTGDLAIYLCSFALALVACLRVLDFRAFSAGSAQVRTMDAATRWERRYTIGAASHVTLLGLWCMAAFARTSDPFVQLLSFAMALAYLVGVSGRNFASRPLVMAQIVGAGVPMSAALIHIGGAYYVILFGVLLPFLIALKLISERLRAVLLDAVIASRNVGLLATQRDAALNNMAQGLCMFDADQRVVVCNDRYAEMYGLTREDVKPGTTLRQILERRIAGGVYAGATPGDYMRERLAPLETASRFIDELNDGRAIAIARRPMAGGGWLTTHEDVTEQRRTAARIAHMAHHDALTGLPNRVLLNDKLAHALHRTRRGGRVAIHSVDLDRFKHVNDSLGHHAGDRLLKEAANRLRALVRETDTVARMGGDEFVVLQTAIADPADITALACRIIEIVDEPYAIDGRQVIISTTVGIAVGPEDGDTAEQLMRNADLALYRAKNGGRGSYCFFEPAMDAEMQERRAMEHDLRNALSAGQLELYYQPVVNIERNEISSLEALIRWHHPQKGMVAPGTFIPLAEEIGFIVPLGEWALKQACAAAASWPSGITVSVNLSPVQFKSPGLVLVVAAALAEAGLPAARLEIEITETAFLEDSQTTLATLHRLRELGVRIAMDDFGTGFSSLSYLQSFPFDKIKIDRTFIENITDSVGSRCIVRAVIAMARGLGMVTTAEGVETSAQLAVVTAEGCTETQGFLFSRPRPLHEVQRLFLSSGADLPKALIVA